MSRPERDKANKRTVKAKKWCPRLSNSPIQMPANTWRLAQKCSPRCRPSLIAGNACGGTSLISSYQDTLIFYLQTAASSPIFDGELNRSRVGCARRSRIHLNHEHCIEQSPGTRAPA